MANTHRGWITLPMAAGSTYRFDQLASMIAAGSCIGGAYEAGASVAFPRAASLFQVTGSITYPFESALFRSSATSMNWSSDPVGTANASVGIPMFGSDPKPIPFPGHVGDLSVYAVGAGTLEILFFQGDDLGI